MKEKKKACPRCEGTGQIHVWCHMNLLQQGHLCFCGGAGTEEKCPRCGGRGSVLVLEE